MSAAWHCCQLRPPQLQIWCFTCQAPRPPFPFPWLQFSDKKNYTRPNLRYIFSLYVNIQMHDACVFLNPCFMVQGCFNPGYLFLWTFYNLQSCSPTYWYNSFKVLPRFHNRYFFYRCTGAKFEKKTGKWDFSDFDDGDRGNGPASKWHSHHQLYPSTHPLFRAPKIIVIILYLYLYFS